MEKYYVRFGNIPSDGKDKIFANGGTMIGVEQGIEVFNALRVVNWKRYQKSDEGKWKTFETDKYTAYKWKIILTKPYPPDKGAKAGSSYVDACLGFSKYVDQERDIFLVTGEEVGYSFYYKLLLKDVKVIKRLSKTEIDFSDNWYNYADYYHYKTMGYQLESSNLNDDELYSTYPMEYKGKDWDNHQYIIKTTTSSDPIAVWHVCTKKIYDEFDGEKMIGNRYQQDKKDGLLMINNDYNYRYKSLEDCQGKR